MVAIVALLLLHVPPVGDAESAILNSAQTAPRPVIVGVAGAVGSTVINKVAVSVPVLSDTV